MKIAASPAMLAPPPTVGEQARRASSARLSNAEVAEALREEIEDLKEFGIDPCHTPMVRKLSERSVRRSSEEEAKGAGSGEEDGEEDLGRMSHKKIMTEFGDNGGEMMKAREKEKIERMRIDEEKMENDREEEKMREEEQGKR